MVTQCPSVPQRVSLMTVHLLQVNRQRFRVKGWKNDYYCLSVHAIVLILHHFTWCTYVHLGPAACISNGGLHHLVTRPGPSSSDWARPGLLPYRKNQAWLSPAHLPWPSPAGGRWAWSGASSAYFKDYFTSECSPRWKWRNAWKWNSSDESNIIQVPETWLKNTWTLYHRSGEAVLHSDHLK